MTPAPVLGIDPGAVDGGAVLLGADGRTVLAAWSWHRLGRTKKRGGRYAWRVSTHLGGHDAEAPTLSAVGLYLACTSPVPLPQTVLVVEGLFGRGRSFQTLCEAAACVYAYWDLHALNDLGAAKEGWRPRSRQWRADILGIASEGQIGADACERRAVEWARDGYDLGALQENGHAAEALALARWGWVRWGHHVG